jgi:uncharacterized protein involved in exopolysaccharide biosynthesis
VTENPLTRRDPAPEAEVPRELYIDEMLRAAALRQSSNDLSLLDFVRIIVRRRLVFLGLFVATLGAIAVMTFTQTPTYESTSVLLVKLGREFMGGAEPGDIAAKRAMQIINRHEVINTEIEILRTQEVIGSVVAEIGVSRLYPDLPAEDPLSPRRATDRFGGNLRVEAVADAPVIRVKFGHPDPAMAAEAVNLLVDRFRERHLWAFGNPQATAFLEEQVSTFRGKLQDLENAIRVLMEEQGGSSLEHATELLSRQRLALSVELNSVKSQIASERAKLGRLEQEKSTLSKYEASDLQDYLDQKLVEASFRLSGLRASKGILEEQMVAYDEQLAELPALRARYDALLREHESTERFLASYSEKLEESLIYEEMDRQKIANIVVLQKGLVPTSPARPRRMLNLAVGAVAAAALGVLGALLLGD